MSRRRERSPENTDRRTRPRIESNRNNNPAFITDLRRHIDSFSTGLSTIEAAMADARGEIRRGGFERSRDRGHFDSTDESVLRDPYYGWDEDNPEMENINVGAYPYHSSRMPHNPWNGYYYNQKKRGDLGFEPNWFREDDHNLDAYYKNHRNFNARRFYPSDIGPSTDLPRLSQRRSDYPTNRHSQLMNEQAIVRQRNIETLDKARRDLRQQSIDDIFVSDDELEGEGIRKTRCWKGYKPVKGKKAYSKGSCKKAK